MLEKITEEQRIKCENCHYRDKTLDKIVFCPYANNCKRKKQFTNPKGYDVVKGGKIK